MTKSQASASGTVLKSLCLCGLLVLAGCSGSVKKVPVAGTVTVNGRPLTFGKIVFNPDSTKGNTAHVACVGRLNSEGHYQIATIGVQGSENGTGAPLGWYKVTFEDKIGATDVEKAVDRIFLDEYKTPLSVEVKDDPEPGAYDFKVTGPKPKK
jgi:hypothetical protein